MEDGLSGAAPAELPLKGARIDFVWQAIKHETLLTFALLWSETICLDGDGILDSHLPVKVNIVLYIKHPPLQLWDTLGITNAETQ